MATVIVALVPVTVLVGSSVAESTTMAPVSASV